MSYEEHDYTAGDSIPESALNADDFVIGGSGEVAADTAKTEAENVFWDLEPGNYLLRVTGFGKIESRRKDTFVNAQPVGYDAFQVEVRFCDDAAPGGRIRSYFLLPPEAPADLLGYNHGTNEKGTAEGFQMKIFDQFIKNLLGDQAFVIDPKTGSKRLSDYAKKIVHWKGRKVWAQVEAGKSFGPPKINPTTGEPFPARDQIKLFSFKPFVEGQGVPYTTDPGKGKAKAAPRPAAVAVAAPAANGFASSGLGVI